MRIHLSSKSLLAAAAALVCAVLAGVVFVGGAHATAQPTVSSVGVPTSGSYAAGQNLDFTVNWSQPVTVNTGGGTPSLPVTVGSSTVQATYLSGSGTSATVFRYTVQPGDTDADGIAAGAALNLNGGSIVDQGDGITVADPTLNAVGSTSSVLVDTTAPTVSSVGVPANSTYATGQNLDFTVNWSESVTVNTGGGTPRIALTVGSSTVYASYLSGSGTTALVFRYTVLSGDADADGIAVGALGLNGGTIKDAAGNNATLTLNSVGSTANVKVDAVAPTVSSVGVPADGSYGTGQNLDFTVNWSEAVTATGTPQIALTVGSTTVQASYLSGSGTTALVFRYTVQAGDTDADGIAVGTLGLNSGTLKDAAGNNATLSLNSVASTANVKVDTTAPTVSSVAVPASVLYHLGQQLNFTVNFSESVVVNTAGGTPSLPVTVGQTSRSAAYVSGSGTTALVFRYTIQAGDSDTDGITVGSALQANGGTIKDASANSATLTLNSVAATSGITVDAVAPTVSSVTAPKDGSYAVTQNIDFTVHFSENVVVSTGGGVPAVVLTVGSQSRNAAYVSGSGTKDVLFRYTVQAGDNDADGITVATAITLNGGSIEDAASNAAALTLPAGTATILVDTTAPTFSSLTAPAAKTYKTGDQLDFSLLFSEKMKVVGTPRLTLTVGTQSHYATYVSGSGTATLLFRYTVVSGDKDSDGISLSNAIDLNSGTLSDQAGNSASLTITVPTLTGVLVDGAAVVPPNGGGGGTPPPPGGKDTTPPSKPAKVSAKTTASGDLYVNFGRSTDNQTVAGYQIIENGKTVKTITATSFLLPLSLPANAKTLTVQVEAIDKAGNHSAPATITVSRPEQPKGLPQTVPAWAYKLLDWQAKPKAKRGEHPATPKRLPDWYWKWAAWEHQPLKATVS